MWWIMMSIAALAAASGATEDHTALGKRNIYDTNEVLLCEEARYKCFVRDGCRDAMEKYLTLCSAVLRGPNPTYCPEICQHSLIALTSTKEGKQLMTCQCSDEFCEEHKRRVEICRPSVLTANQNGTVVSCRVAQWICNADVQCATALDYYNRYCRTMFHGKKCTSRCRNSISILQRQDKAAKLKTCKCDGQEDYNCTEIQKNMARLCFHKKIYEESTESAGDIETNVIRNDFETRAQAGAHSTLLARDATKQSVGLLLLLVSFLIAVT